ICIDGILWGFGSNAGGRTGLGVTGSTTLRPRRVASVYTGLTGSTTTATIPNFQRVFAGYNGTFAIDNLNRLWAFGANAESRHLGSAGFSGNITSARRVSADGVVVTFASMGRPRASGFSSIASSGVFNGQLYTWGCQEEGITGQGVSGIPTPPRITTPRRVSNV
ncbi:MAG: hypothetical protein FWB72_07220, partial [Firmicutes bacterium]|nr:hypothetical protein [Bacillota bacterium]